MEAILVLDGIPEKCGDCQFAHEYDHSKTTGVIGCDGIDDTNPDAPGGGIIGVYNDDIDSITKSDVYDRHPDWCPLKELPEWMDCDKAVAHGATDSDYIYGWNDCLDEILGTED